MIGNQDNAVALRLANSRQVNPACPIPIAERQIIFINSQRCQFCIAIADRQRVILIEMGNQLSVFRLSFQVEQFHRLLRVYLWRKGKRCI